MPEIDYEELRTQVHGTSHIRAFVVVDEVKKLLAERDYLAGKARTERLGKWFPFGPREGAAKECPQDAEDRELAEAINEERARRSPRGPDLDIGPSGGEPQASLGGKEGDVIVPLYSAYLDTIEVEEFDTAGQSLGPRGGRRVFETGAVRSTDADEFRYDLITPIGLRAVAAAYAEGSGKYGDFNWEKGMPAHDLLNHVLKHIYDFLAGSDDPTELGHAAWGVLAAIHSLEMWPHLNVSHLRQKGCLPPLRETES